MCVACRCVVDEMIDVHCVVYPMCHLCDGSGVLTVEVPRVWVVSLLGTFVGLFDVRVIVQWKRFNVKGLFGE